MRPIVVCSIGHKKNGPYRTINSPSYVWRFGARTPTLKKVSFQKFTLWSKDKTYFADLPQQIVVLSTYASEEMGDKVFVPRPFSRPQETPQQGSEAEISHKLWDDEFSSSTTHTGLAPLSTPCDCALEDPPEARQRYFSLCVPLHKASIRGEWKKAKAIIDKEPDIVRASITKGLQTPLHVAAGAGKAEFVKNLLKCLTEEDLLMKDAKGNTAFCFAVAAGKILVAKILIQKNPALPKIRGGEGMSTLYMAAVFGHSEMAWFLYPQLIHSVDEGERAGTFFTCINNELYDLALKMLHDFKELAVARDTNNETALHLLARKLSISVINSPKKWKRSIKSFVPGKQSNKAPGLQLLKYLWDIILRQNDWMITDVIRRPSHVLFTAARLGNFDFVAALVGTYPDLVWEIDDGNWSLFHVSVMYHHMDIFNLVLQLGVYKDLIISYKDDSNNNILHLAAKLAPLRQLSTVSGPALQMHRELLFFEGVRKVVPPFYLEMENSDGKTPSDIFTEEHRDLMEKGESWMKNMATSGALLSAIIGIPLFSSAVLHDRKTISTSVQETTFPISVISDGVGLLSASIGIFIFLSILSSRFAEKDFLKSLPLRIMLGRTALFVSAASMTVTFGYHQRLIRLPTLIFALASLLLYYFPYPLFSNVITFKIWSFISSKYK